MTRALAALTVILIPMIVGAEDQDGFRPLFDGQTLEGWVQRGGKARYTVEDGCVVGQSVPNTSNSFLCTSRDYANFELELDFKVDPALNSGVQIRSQSFDESKTLKLKVGDVEKSVDVPAGRVHGYQVEIDPLKRAWSGGIYDEGRRGWLYDLSKNDAAREAFKSNDWNHFRIVADGSSIKTWINEVPAADLTDDVTPSGFIALQVHGVGDRAEPLFVRWKNIRIKELP